MGTSRFYSQEKERRGIECNAIYSQRKCKESRYNQFIKQMQCEKKLPRTTGTRTTYTNTTLWTRPHTHRLAQIKPQNNSRKKEIKKNFPWAGPGRAAGLGRVAAKWRPTGLLRTALARHVRSAPLAQHTALARAQHTALC